ncbi:DUF3781 domain-containing protein [Anaerorhabdus sp.]|uniref:DUF3781 domain-containing protein n=1 Tax=Anaerorhabdus sp. TaxID=1872524 RepID=UPI003FA55CA5
MSNYIMDLRKIVGHRALLQVGASVIVEDKEGRILLQKRRDNHCWGYAGGSVELDEVVEEAAKRELFEETGLIAHKLEFFGVFSGSHTHYIYPNGDEVSNVDIVFICREYSGQLSMQESEVEDLQFFRFDDLPKQISPPIARALNQWVEIKRKGNSLRNVNELLENLDKIKTTELGKKRILKNLGLKVNDIIAWCKSVVLSAENIESSGKNWYVYKEDYVITINASSYTIITAHRQQIK